MSNLSRFLESIGPSPNSALLTPSQQRQLIERLNFLGQAMTEQDSDPVLRRESTQVLRLCGKLDALASATTGNVAEVVDLVVDLTERTRRLRELPTLRSAIGGVVESIVEIARDKHDGALLDRVQRAIDAL
jgi:hypothetical protein